MGKEERVSNLGKPSTTESEEGTGSNSKLVEVVDVPCVVVPISEKEEEVMGRRSGEAVMNPSWFTPKRLLLIFCVINMLNYVDRGVIASNGGKGIQGEFKLSNFEDGVLSSAFMVGLLISSPVFASLAKSYNPFKLIGVGLSVWTLATLGCGSSFDFWSIAICRMLVGVGEASFISVAAPFIDDNASVAKKTAWLAMFYMCIPTGIALVYVYGGFVGDNFSWRWAFWGGAILMLPFAIFGFVMKPLQLKGFSPSGSSQALKAVETVNESKDLDLRETTTRWLGMEVIVIGYIAYNFVIGAYSYWGPKAGYNIYRMKSADMTFGGITVVCGILGTLAGGYILYRMVAILSNAFKLLTSATFFGAIFCLSAFCMKNMYAFIALFVVGELLVFATQVSTICCVQNANSKCNQRFQRGIHVSMKRKVPHDTTPIYLLPILVTLHYLHLTILSQ